MSKPTINCLCGAISGPIATELPAKTELCHCDACRHTTGGLFLGCAEMSQPPDEEIVARCTTYRSSETHDRYFCSTCGTKIFVKIHHFPDGSERNSWFAVGGAVEWPKGAVGKDNTLRVVDHEWVEDAGDGSLAPYMTRLGGRNIPTYHGGLESNDGISQRDLDEMTHSTSLNINPLPQDRLEVKCRCGGVSLLLKPADHTDRTVSKLDRFIPFRPDGSRVNDKYQARTCVCRSCRLATGVSLNAWTYIPPAQILNANTGEPLAYAYAATTPEGEAANRGLKLKHHWSSELSCRSFCADCGASVFFWYENRQEIVNIAAGLLRAEEGAMARGWLYWQPGMVSWKKDEDKQVVDREILDAYVEAGDIN